MTCKRECVRTLFCRPLFVFLVVAVWLFFSFLGHPLLFPTRSSIHSCATLLNPKLVLRCIKMNHDVSWVANDLENEK